MELIGWGVDFPRSYLAVLLWREIAWLKERKRKRKRERGREKEKEEGSVLLACESSSSIVVYMRNASVEV